MDVLLQDENQAGSPIAGSAGNGWTVRRVRRRNRRLLALVCLGFVTVAAFAPAAESEFAALVREAFERNPTVKAARAEWAASIARLPQARALPDPMVRFDVFGESVETRVGPQRSRAGVSQAFPFPGTLKQAEGVAAKEVRVRQLAYEIALRDLVVDLQVGVHELLYLQGAAAITAQNQELLEHVLQVATARYATDKAKLADVLRAQSQLAQLGYDLILLRELEAVEVARVNALLDRPSEQPLAALSAPALRSPQGTALELEATALAQRQELAMARAMAAKAREAVALAGLRNKPSFELGAMWIETGDGGEDPWLLGGGMRVPLWGERNQSRVAEAEAHVEAAEQRVRALENETRAAVKSVYFKLQNARRLVALYEESLIPQAKAAMAVAEQWHDGETPDMSGFLETQGVWLNFNLARLRALTDQQQHRVRLERLLGGVK